MLKYLFLLLFALFQLSTFQLSAAPTASNEMNSESSRFFTNNHFSLQFANTNPISPQVVSENNDAQSSQPATFGPNKVSERMSISPDPESFINGMTYLFVILIVICSIFLFWYKHKLYLTLISIFASAFLVEALFENDLKNQHYKAVELDTIQILSSVSAKLEGNLQTNLSMLTGFAAYISAVPDLTQQEYSNYAKELFKKEPLLINFAAAKDLVVNYVYPLEGNEKVIGLDYRKNTAQRTLALQVAETGKLMVVGPISLVQGGTAFIGRAPIFTGDNEHRRFWGIISAPLDEKALYRESGINELDKNFGLAIRNIDSLGNMGAVFLGNESIFLSEKRIQYSIEAGGGTWQVAAVPNPQSTPISSNLTIVRLVFTIVAIILASFAVLRFRQKQVSLKLEQSLREHQRLLEKVGSVAQIGGWKLDSCFNFFQWTEQTSKTLRQDVQFKPTSLESIRAFFVDQDFDTFEKAIARALSKSSQIDLELQLNHQSQPDTWVRVIAKTSDAAGEARQVTGTFQDVTNKVRSARIIEHQATYDALTDLPNRILFNDRLTLAIEDAQRNNTKLGVLFIDLDRFKPVNDNYGHSAGDKLLIQSAKRIKESIRDSDTVSRLSGDEFGVLLTDIVEYENVIKITESVLESLRLPYQLDSVMVHGSASIGIALYPEDGDNAQALIRKADQAMYEVKSQGRNDWQFYTREMQIKSEYRHRLLNDLTDAIRENVLLPYFQPIMDLNTGLVTKCEALARWQKPDGQFVPPIEFITLAEESGMINDIDLYILESAAKMLIDKNQFDDPVELSINVSPRLFQTKDKALNLWLSSIEKYAALLPITVEITERLLTDDSAKALNVLTRLKSHDVKIAIDDFGTGYSSLSYLIKFPVDIIKIDREFVDKIGKDTSSDTLIETILLMAKRLDLKVVAEGIETAEQQDFLRQHGCQFGQGYYLGKPMPVKDFSKFVESNIS